MASHPPSPRPPNPRPANPHPDNPSTPAIPHPIHQRLRSRIRSTVPEAGDPEPTAQAVATTERRTPVSVNWQSTFKKDERENNGLEAIAEELIANPLTRHVVVGVIETTRITKDVTDGGTETPTVRWVQVEALEGADAEQARAMLNAVFRKRTGRTDDPQQTLFEAPDADSAAQPVEDDPTAGPWPGDDGYPADTQDEPADVSAGATGKRGRRS